MSCHFTMWQRNALDFLFLALSREGYPENETRISCVLSAYCRPAAEGGCHRGQVGRLCSHLSKAKSLIHHRLAYIYIYIILCIYILMYFWLCWVFVVGFSLVAVSRGYSLVGVHGLLIVVASLVVEHRLQGTRASVVAARGLSSCGSQALSTGSVVVVHWLSCSNACGIFPDLGIKPASPAWQASS